MKSEIKKIQKVQRWRQRYQRVMLEVARRIKFKREQKEKERLEKEKRRRE